MGPLTALLLPLFLLLLLYRPPSRALLWADGTPTGRLVRLF